MGFRKISEEPSFYNDLESKSVRELLEEINAEDQKVALAVKKTIPQVEKFVELLVQIKYITADGDDRKEVRHYRIDREDAVEDIGLVEREDTAFWGCVERGVAPPLKIQLPATPRLKGELFL